MAWRRGPGPRSNQLDQNQARTPYSYDLLYKMSGNMKDLTNAEFLLNIVLERFEGDEHIMCSDAWDTFETTTRNR